jgi:hypothetical protein
MWIRTQDKTKIVNTDHVQLITTSKSYGSKDSKGEALTSAIIFQPIHGSVISMGLYHDIYESREVMDKIMEYIASGKENTFQMP